MTMITIIGSGHFGSVLYHIVKKNHPAVMVKKGEPIDLQSCSLLIIAIPVMAYDDLMTTIKKNHQHLPPTIICSKGIADNQLLPYEIIEKHFPNTNIGVLSGPNFAHELQKQLPTASVIASHQKEIIAMGQKILQQPFWRLYPSPDPIGVSLNGAMKNVLAIASGITIGKSLGDNARASLISRGLAEMRKLLLARQRAGDPTINPDSCYGLSGAGDLILTAHSPQSRNTSLGINIAKHTTSSITTLLANQKTKGIAEGYYAAKYLHLMAQKLELSLPIVSTVADILYHHLSVDDAINRLLLRPMPTSE